MVYQICRDPLLLAAHTCLNDRKEQFQEQDYVQFHSKQIGLIIQHGKEQKFLKTDISADSMVYQ